MFRVKDSGFRNWGLGCRVVYVAAFRIAAVSSISAMNVEIPRN